MSASPASAPVPSFSGYICKTCGAESPVGIGYYAVNGAPDTHQPAAGCPGPHVER